MKNIYKLLKLNRYIQNVRIKCLGVYGLHILGKRYLGVFFDPVLACNLRCKMCYFSDPERRKTLKGSFNPEDLNVLANAFFSRTLKLQIGCGAEPAIFPYNKELILLGKQYNVPYISMTTNGNLFADKDWKELIEAGLDEVTLSVHGVKKESYEYFMEGASFEKFHEAMSTLTEIKKQYPDFKIRLNYTVNKDNLDELTEFFDSFDNYAINILQIRPIQNIGNSVYNDFSWEKIIERYDSVIKIVRENCINKNIICIAPEKKDLKNEPVDNNLLIEATYCNITPQYVWKEDFDWQKETYDSYAKRTGLSKRLFRNVFKKNRKKESSKNSLNYTVK